MNFSNYLNKINSETVRPVNWLFGQEKKLIDLIAEALLKKAEFQEKHVLFGGEMDTDNFVRSLFETDLFAASQVFLIRDCNEISWNQKAEKSFLRWLDNPAGSNTLIFIGNGKNDFPAAIKKQISHKASLFELKPLYENEIRDYIKNLASSADKHIDGNTIQLLIELCGTDLQEIHSQWDKLLLYLEDKSNISIEDVEDVVGLTSHFNVFQMIDNMMSGNKGKALKIIHAMLEAGIHPLQPMALVIRHFSQLEQLMLAGSDSGRQQELRTALKIWDFQYKKMQNQMRRLNLVQVEAVIQTLAEIDEELKSRSVPAAHYGVVFEKGMLKIFSILK